MDLFIPEEIKNISNILNNSGFQCFLVGGAIRDQLLGKEAKDFDLTTDAKPEDIIKLFKRVIPTGIKHGTVTILLKGKSFEITTYRIDGKYSDGRRPDKIIFTPSIEEDLLRRDFTINSIAYNVIENSILDINNGINDLNERKIKAIGIPSKRFDEDALRLVRACRFSAQLEFNIDSETYTAMSNTLGKLKDVSKERISDELIKILNSNKPSIAFTHFYNCGMLEILFPTIYISAVNDYKTFISAIEDMDNIESNKAYIKFARLLSITDKSCHLTTLKGLKLSNDFINSSLHLLNYINYDITNLNNDYNMRVFISEAGIEYLNDINTVWIGMKQYDNSEINKLMLLQKNQIDNNFAFRINDLKISGNDLMSSLNLNPGPHIGELLKELLKMVLKYPNLNNKEKLINLAENMV